MVHIRRIRCDHLGIEESRSAPIQVLLGLDAISMNRKHALLTLILVYGAASLVHFMHNAVYLERYPNMPAWLTPLGVLASWLVVAGTGAVGYWLLRKGLAAAGLGVITLYAALGFAGLDHYAIAPISAHSLAMNATIIGEVIAASVLLVVTAWIAIRGGGSRT